jgi:signal transduction histidine kinase
MAVRPPDSRLEAWERREQPLTAVVPWFALVLSVIPVAVLDSHSATALATGMGLAVLAALWMLWFYRLHPPGWKERPRWPTLAMTGLLALMAAMVLHNPVYGIYTWTGYIFVYRSAHGRWRLLATFVVAVIGATSQDGGLPRSPAQGAFYAILLLFNAAVALAFTWFASVSYEQNERRKQLVGELSEANRKLEATMRENAGLHEQLLTQAREAGVMDERQRMAREIHDTLAQGLTGIITQLQAATQDDGERRVEAAIGLARESLSEARRSVHELRPEPLETARLGEALGDVAQRWSALHGVLATVTTTGLPRQMPAEVEVTLLRTAQEALANVAKHANATRVGLTLSYMEDEVALDVRDDGVGFDPASMTVSADGGFGLTAMRQRVERLAGTLEIESERGTGTAISACVPASTAPPPLPHQATA